MSSDEPYEVGYGRPPKHSRFKKGAPSPNPGGRPRASKSSATLVRETLSARVPLRENGRVRNVSKFELGLTQLANKAANGDLKAIQIVIGLYRAVEAEADSRSEGKPLDSADREILEMLVRRMREGDAKTSNGGR